MIWFIHFIVVNFLLFISNLRKNEKIFIYGAFLYSITVFGQRWMTGEDFPGYLLYYLTGFSGEELGYFIFQNLFASMNLYFGLFIFLIYCITLFNNFKFIKRINKNTVFMIYIYMFIEIYFMQMSQLRQFLAISFFIHSYFYIFQGNYFKSTLNFIIAISFHLSAVLMLPLLFIRMKFSKKMIYIIVLILSIFPLVNVKVLFDYGSISIYSHFFESVYDTGLSFVHYLRYYSVLFIILIYITTIKISLSSRNDKMILNGVFIYLMIYGLSFHFAPLMRVSYYLKIFELIFFVYYIKDLKKNSLNLVKGAITSLFILFYLSIALIDPYNISRYQYRPLQLYENRSDSELLEEIYNFYYD